MLISPADLHAPPRTVLRHAEAMMEASRAQPTNMAASVAAALAEASGGAVPTPVSDAGGAIAAAVAAHAATCSPPYHDQRHQAEATRAMGWLCALARRRGELTAAQAAAGVLAMAGHDLRHDGLVHPPGALETLSAGLTLDLAATAGLDDATCAAIRQAIMATDPLRPAAVAARDDLLCRLAQEADMFASLTPGLGWRLGEALARELAAAGATPRPSLASYAGRLAWLRHCRPPTACGRALGLADIIADQVAALARLGGGDAEHGALSLDAAPPQEARARYLAILQAP